jgi:hypothetical protein
LKANILFIKVLIKYDWVFYMKKIKDIG